MKSIRSLGIILGIILILLVIKHFFFPAPKGETSGGPPQKPPAPVRVMIAGTDTLLEDIFVNGSLSGTESIDLQPETQGKVVSLFFEEGEEVKKGELLIKLNDTELQAGLKKVQSQITIASEKLNRLKKLIDVNGISREEYESALNLVQSLEADKAYTEAMIQKTELRAPFSGTIGLRNVSPGSMVSSGTIIATLEQSDPMKLDISVPEKYSHLLGKGAHLSFRVEQLEEEFHGVVYATDPRIDPSTRSLRLRARCSNPEGKLKAGSFARVKLALKEHIGAVMIPSEAIVPELKGNKVFIVKNGESVPVSVQTGIRSSRKVEITSGLQAGDSVIVSGYMQLKPGQKVSLVR